MSKKLNAVENVLGKRLHAYYADEDGLYLRFEDGAILQWSGYHSKPIDADDSGLRETWEENAGGEWVKFDDDE